MRNAIEAFLAERHLAALTTLRTDGSPHVVPVRYLDAWFDALALDGVTLVGHDWGGALAEIERHDVVAGHHTPEDHPLAIAKAVAEWADRHRLR